MRNRNRNHNRIRVNGTLYEAVKNSSMPLVSYGEWKISNNRSTDNSFYFDATCSDVTLEVRIDSKYRNIQVVTPDNVLAEIHDYQVPSVSEFDYEEILELVSDTYDNLLKRLGRMSFGRRIQDGLMITKNAFQSALQSL